MSLEQAVTALRELHESRPSASWRLLAYERLDDVQRALVDYDPYSDQPWLDPRCQSLSRSTRRLQSRVAAAKATILQRLDPVRIREEVDRLLVDLERAVQRDHDLRADEVSYETGGSE